MTDPFCPARGSYVLVRSPEFGAARGLVVFADDASGRAAISYDANPAEAYVVPYADLAPASPFEERPCLSSDPTCSSLRPCRACGYAWSVALADAIRETGVSYADAEKLVKGLMGGLERTRAGAVKMLEERRAATLAPIRIRAEETRASVRAEGADVVLRVEGPIDPSTPAASSATKEDPAASTAEIGQVGAGAAPSAEMTPAPVPEAEQPKEEP